MSSTIQLIPEVTMIATRIGLSLLVIAAVTACGDASSPDGKSAVPAGPASTAGPRPADILAALPPEAQPYGLDVYGAHCVKCHGDTGQGVDNHPPLKGMTPTAMYQKLLDFRGGNIQGEQAGAMRDALKGLSDAEIAAVSIYAGE
jgi:cytochrome c553